MLSALESGFVKFMKTRWTESEMKKRSKLEQTLLSQLVQRGEEDQDESEEEKSDGRSVGWEGMMQRSKRDQLGVKGPGEGAKLTGIEGGRYNVEADGVIGTGRA